MPNAKCVVISCVTFETSMIVDPAVGFKADEVHLFHYVSSMTQSGSVYEDFYSEVCRLISVSLPKAVIIEHAKDPVYDFHMMLKGILGIISDIRSSPGGKDARILVNASSGTSEFVAAAVIASLMSKGTRAFTVGTKKYTIKEDRIRECYYSEGRPVGLTEGTYAPKMIPAFDLPKPDERAVRALRIYYGMYCENRSTTASSVIEELKSNGKLWKYEPNIRGSKTEIKQKETMYYQRHFIDVWKDSGWVDKPSRRARFTLTEAGMIVINTFYAE